MLSNDFCFSGNIFPILFFFYCTAFFFQYRYFDLF